MLIVFASTSSAQVFEQIEARPDGSRIIKIDGELFRAITPAKVEEIANQRDALAVCKENEGRNLQRIELAAKDVKIAEQQAALEHSNFVRVMALYEKERELRQASMGFIPHSNVGGFWGKVLTALDHPASQAFWKMALPMATFIKGVRNQ